MEKFLDIDNLARIVITLGIITLGIVAICYAINLLRKHVLPLNDKGMKRGIIRKVILPLSFLFVLIALRLASPLLIKEAELLLAINHFLMILLIIAGTWIAINAIRITRIVVLARYDVSQNNNLQARKMHTQLKIIERIVVFVIVFVSVASILLTFESIRRIGVSLFASAGLAGLIIGLAAQRVIGSILAGFQLAITQPIRIDDVVIVENEWGWIEEITLTYVVIRLWDSRRMVVPTTYFIDKPFQNWTRKSSEITGSVFIFTDYTMPVDMLRSEFLEILKHTDLWDGHIANVQVTNATSQALEIRFLMSALDSPTLWDLRAYVREKLVEYLQLKHPDKLPKTRVNMQP